MPASFFLPMQQKTAFPLNYLHSPSIIQYDLSHRTAYSDKSEFVKENDGLTFSVQK